MKHVIRNLISSDEVRFKVLWKSYLQFYKASLSDDVTDCTFARIAAGEDRMLGRGAFVGSQLVGFSISILHPSTWSRAPSCYLEDLFVAMDKRGHGIGRALIQDLIERGKLEQWSKLYWHTHRGNRQARNLYDSFGPVDEFVRYVIELNTSK